MAINPITGLEETPVVENTTGSLPLENAVTPNIQEEPIEEVKVEEITPETPIIPEVPVIEEVKPVEPVKIETPKVPTDTTTPVEDKQALEANKQAIDANERLVVAENNAKAIAEFDSALQSGATIEELAIIANANPDSRDSFNSLLRTKFKNDANVQFMQKYSGMSNEAMTTAVNNSEIVIGGDKYKLLSPEQRASFEQFYKESTANNTKEDDNLKFTNDENNIISNSKQDAEMSAFVGLDVRKKSKALFNTPEITNSSTVLRDKRNEIDEMNETIEDIRSDVESEFPHANSSLIASIIADRTNKLRKSKNTLINEYNSELGNYTRLKDNASQELELLKYEDLQARQSYNDKLNIYQTDQKNMTAIAKAEFEAETKERAANVKFQRDLLIKEFDAQLKKEQKGGVYETDRQGRQVYIKDGVSSFVRDVEGDILFTETNAEYTDTTTKENGVIVTTRSYKDGRQPEYFTYDINGNSSTNSNNVVNNLISNVKGDLQCGEAVNKYVQGQLGISRKDFHMGDSYASKKKFINDSTPIVGGIAIWNDQNAAEGKFAEFGHTGIVTGYDLENGTVQITDWNWKGDEKKSVHDVKISDIIGSDGGFYNPDSIPKAVGFDSEDTPLYKKFLAGKLTASDQKGITDFETFKVKAELYQDNKTAEGTNQIEKLIKLTQDLLDSPLGKKRRILAGTGAGTFFSDDLGDYQASFDSFISISALDNLVSLKADGATFGALSDNELQFIKDSSTLLRANLSDTKFKEVLNETMRLLKKGLSTERLAELETPIVEETIKTTSTRQSILDSYNKTKSARNLDYLN